MKNFIKKVVTLISASLIVLGAGCIIFTYGSCLGKLTAQAGGADGKMLKVAIIDSGLDLNDPRFKDVLCKEGHKDFTGDGIQDDYGHGTHIAGLIKKHAGSSKNYCLIILKYCAFDDCGPLAMQRNIESIKRAGKYGAYIINISSDGYDQSHVEHKLIRDNKQITFVVAAGNYNEFYKTSFPAGYGEPNIIPVGNWDCERGVKAPRSNWGTGIKWECGINLLSEAPRGEMATITGTSQAAAVYTGKLIKKRLEQMK